MKHKGKLNIDYENSIFIDDNPLEIESIIEKKPKMIIRMQRNNSKYSNISLDIDINTVVSLDEIIQKRLLNNI
jgi:predicted enzyme involved in methoxymalonyl-ACP biosynthesis